MCDRVGSIYPAIPKNRARRSASASAESKTLGAPFAPVHRWTQNQIELVDQSDAQKVTVGATASFQQQPFHVELRRTDVTCIAMPHTAGPGRAPQRIPVVTFGVTWGSPS